MQAYEVLSNSQQCRQYVEELRGDEPSSSQHEDEDFSADGTGFPTAPGSRTYSYPCYNGAAPHIHKLHITTRNKLRARYCRRCRIMHPAQDGDGWLESQHIFARAKVRAALHGRA